MCGLYVNGFPWAAPANHPLSCDDFADNGVFRVLCRNCLGILTRWPSWWNSVWIMKLSICKTNLFEYYDLPWNCLKHSNIIVLTFLFHSTSFLIHLSFLFSIEVSYRIQVSHSIQVSYFLQVSIQSRQRARYDYCTVSIPWAIAAIAQMCRWRPTHVQIRK